MDTGEDDGSFGAIENALGSAAWIGQVPWLFWLHDFLMPVFGNHLGVNARHGGLRQFAAREINARKDRGSDHYDILSKLFAVQREKPDDMTENAVISMATSNIFAGSDTTAISLRAVLYYLLKNPSTKQKLVEEISQFKNKETVGNTVSLDQAKRMPYLQGKTQWSASPRGHGELLKETWSVLTRDTV
jgi:cytochrome P450